MKHPNDPGTIEMKLPAKRGRPTILASALTPAERARRYRNKKADRFGMAFSEPELCDTGLLCQALAWLAANPSQVSAKTSRVLSHLISSVLASRFPKP